MKTINIFKQLLLLCLLFAGTASAQETVYQWTKVTDLSEVQTDDIVVIVDESQGIALPNTGEDFQGVSVTLSGGYISSDVSDNIKWTLTKGSSTFIFTKSNDSQMLWGDNDTGIFLLGLTEENYTTRKFKFDNYASGGKLYFEYEDQSCYVYWTDNKAKLSFAESDAATITLYKRVEAQPTVKWKKVGTTAYINGTQGDVTLSDDDVVLIVDLTTGRTMSNDKGDKDPDAVAVDLNDDKDRVLGDVADKLQWTYNGAQDGYKFTTGENNLYADSKGLKVGTNDENNLFTSQEIDDVAYLSVTVSEKEYLAGVESSMFSNSWILKELTTENKPDDSVKDTRYAFFKKVEDEQINATIDLAENWSGKKGDVLDLQATCTGANVSEIQWSSSDTEVATVADGIVTLRKRGIAIITASIAETDFHDKASAKCTVRIDDPLASEPGCNASNPLSVAEAKELAEKGEVTIEGTGTTITLQEGVNYYIKGKVSKVNSGMLAMFGDMDFGSMGGDSGMDFDEMMEDMDFDMDSMGDMGFDMSSMGFDMSAFFGSSEGVTYYISDDGTKDNQMKVVNGRGVITSNNGGAVKYDANPNLSVGDCLTVCGPLVYSEDTNMFSSMMGGNDDEPKMSAKVDELNYLAIFDPTLLVEDKEIYVNKTLNGIDVYSIDNYFDEYSHQEKITQGMEIQEPVFKSSDEEIAKWDEDTKKIVGVNEGTAKITVKVKVVLTPDNPDTDDNEEKSYTMKRKFKLTVKSRDIDPAGYYDGDYVLTTNTDDLKEGTRMILVGTRVKDDKETDYVMGENNSMMGGGKSGSKIEIEDPDKEKIPCEDAPDGTLEVILEKADESSWYLNVGEDENGNKLYLYASVKQEDSESGSGSGSGTGNGSGLNMDEMMEMFNPSSGLKVGTKAGTVSTVEGVDSLKATITFSENIANIKFPAIADDKNNTIMLSSAFDMESMMSMFSSNSEGGDDEQESENSFDMGSFDMFMASFNTKKPGDETPEEGKAPKNFMPRIYRFVPDPSFAITIGNSEWRTIVTYKNVEVPENVDAYIVTKVQPEETQSLAILQSVERLKGGEPYLLHIASGNAKNYTMTLISDEEEVPAPTNNKLKKSDRTTTGSKGNSTVFVLANKTKGVGFYRWIGDELGRGRVYLPVEAKVAGVHEFCGFLDEATGIKSIDSHEQNTGYYYDLQGRRVLKPVKGIYVLDGKKVLIK